MSDTLSAKWISYLFGKGDSRREKAKMIMEEIVLQYKLEDEILDHTYMNMFGSKPDYFLGNPIQFGKKYRALTLKEIIVQCLHNYIQEVERIIENSKNSSRKWGQLFTLFQDKQFTFYLDQIKECINAYFYQKNNPEAYLSGSNVNNWTTKEANIGALDTLSDADLDASWLTYFDGGLTSEVSLKKRAAHLAQYTARKRTPPIQLRYQVDPIKPDGQTKDIAKSIVDQAEFMDIGTIDYAWDKHRTDPDFKKLVAYQNVVIDELKRWFIDSTSERKREIIKQWFGKEKEQNMKRNGKYVFQTNSGDPDISYEYFDTNTQAWEKRGILSQDEYKQEVIKHLSQLPISLTEYHEKYLTALINDYFYTTMQSLGLKGFVRQKPTPLMRYVGKYTYEKNARQIRPINQKVYHGTINGRNHNATVSRRYKNAPLAKGEIHTRIGNRNYAVTVKGGRKTRRKKAHRNKSNRR